MTGGDSVIPREAHNTVMVVLGTGNVVSTSSGEHGEVP